MEPIITLNQCVGRYRVDEFLRRETVTEYYRAQDIHSGQTVIIKSISASPQTTASLVELKYRFNSEYEKLTLYKHAGVIKVLEYLEFKGLPILVLENHKLEHLQYYISRSARFSLENVVSILQQLLATLRYIHQQQGVHGALSPAAIYLFENCKIKLRDFSVNPLGTVTEKIEMEHQLETLYSDSGGASIYLAPEQIQRNKISNCSDLYSATMILYVLLTCSRAQSFAPPYGPELSDQISINSQDLADYIPEEFIPIITKGLSGDENKRYRSAYQFTTTLLNTYRIYLGLHEKKRETSTGNIVEELPDVLDTGEKNEIPEQTPLNSGTIMQ